MKKETRVVVAIVVTTLALFVFALWYFLRGQNIAMLEPSGLIAAAERDLIVKTFEFMLFVVVSVFVLLIAFTWRYRASNVTAKYWPNWEHNRVDEAIWWAIPFAIILMLSVVTWESTHELDPSRALVHDAKPLTIEVVALDWKWLFIYPEQGIASVNEVAFPAHTPIRFRITSAGTMNSFAIPHLAGQIYAMAGGASELHLIADETGVFPGISANFSGRGFAGMRFSAKALSADDFAAWVENAKQHPVILDRNTYATLARPSENESVSYYGIIENDLFENIVMKFMMPASVHNMQMVL